MTQVNLIFLGGGIIIGFVVCLFLLFYALAKESDASHRNDI